MFKMGRPRNAKRYIKEAIENGGSTNSEILLHYGDIQYKLNRKREAIDSWKNALKYADKDQIDEINKRIAETELKQ